MYKPIKSTGVVAERPTQPTMIRAAHCPRTARIHPGSPETRYRTKYNAAVQPVVDGKDDPFAKFQNEKMWRTFRFFPDLPRMSTINAGELSRFDTALRKHPYRAPSHLKSRSKKSDEIFNLSKKLKNLCKSSIDNVNEGKEVQYTRRIIVAEKSKVERRTRAAVTVELANKISSLESACVKLKKSGGFVYYDSAWEKQKEREDRTQQEIINETMKEKKNVWRKSILSTLYPGVSQTAAIQKMSPQNIKSRLLEVCNVDLSDTETKALYKAMLRR